ncbi:MAG: universal stress protein [Gaiellaceae bacterium]
MSLSVRGRQRLAGKRIGFARRRPRVLSGYRRMLVPVGDNPQSEKAIDVASRLAVEHGSSIVALAVIEVPSVLPLNAHMVDEEREAHQLLERATALAELYGVGVSPRVMRARDAATAIVEEATVRGSETILIGAPHRVRASKGVAVFGSTVEHVLKRAPCRVMVIGTPQAAPPRQQTAT